MKTEEEIKDAIAQAILQSKRADSMNEVKYWHGFEAALEWLNSKEEKQDGFTE